MADWRLIQDPPQPGAWNMAVDVSILEAYRRGQAPPTLRLYDWAHPTLSIGYAQPLAEVDLARCRQQGIRVVRRPTGGRAVLHGAGDLTYALIASESEGFPPDLSGTYRRIAQAIAEALSRLGVSAELLPGERTAPGASACFATGTRADLLAQGMKLVGSAQLRRQGGFLQHGALMLTQEPAAIQSLLGTKEPPARMTNLQRLIGRADREWVRAELATGLARALGIAWLETPLSACEAAAAEALAAALQLA